MSFLEHIGAFNTIITIILYRAAAPVAVVSVSVVFVVVVVVFVSNTHLIHGAAVVPPPV